MNELINSFNELKIVVWAEHTNLIGEVGEKKVAERGEESDDFAVYTGSPTQILDTARLLELQSCSSWARRTALVLREAAEFELELES